MKGYEGYIITIVCLFAIWYHYKYVFLPHNKIKNDLKKAALPKDNADAQDEDYCLIASSINHCNTYKQFEDCIKAIKVFQGKYGKTFTGQQDVSSLIDQYEAREQKILNVVIQ